MHWMCEPENAPPPFRQFWAGCEPESPARPFRRVSKMTVPPTLAAVWAPWDEKTYASPVGTMGIKIKVSPFGTMGTQCDGKLVLITELLFGPLVSTSKPSVLWQR